MSPHRGSGREQRYGASWSSKPRYAEWSSDSPTSTGATRANYPSICIRDLPAWIVVAAILVGNRYRPLWFTVNSSGIHRPMFLCLPGTASNRTQDLPQEEQHGGQEDPRRLPCPL